MSKLTIQYILILTTLVAGWVIFMLSIHYKHKKRMRQIDKEWEERRRRCQLERVVWLAGSAMVPYDEVRPKTDKLSPPKKVGKHTMR
jgi:uncharacterized protein (DUF1919 family)